MKGPISWAEKPKERRVHREHLERVIRDEEDETELSDVAKDSLTLLNYLEVVVTERDAAHAALGIIRAECAQLMPNSGHMYLATINAVHGIANTTLIIAEKR